MSASVECVARLVCVDPALVPIIWRNVADLIRRAMARGRMGSFTDVEADVLRANAYLWLALNGAGVLAAVVGLMVLAQWPFSGAWVPGTLVGISLIFSGWSYVAVALAVRRVAA